MKIEAYQVLQASSPDAMCAFAKDLIDDGWEPYGGVAWGGGKIFQAFVKYEVTK